MSDLRHELVKLASLFYQRGWLLGTSGNVSARLEDGSFWTIVKDSPRRNLRLEDFIRLTTDGKIVEETHSQDQPTEETSIHEAIYQLFPRVAACYQLHSIEATILSNMGERVAVLPPMEVLRPLATGQSDFRIELPIFDSHIEVRQIARDIGSRFRSRPPNLPALLIRNHSLVVWASSPANALNYVELLDHAMRYTITAHRLSL